MLKIGHDVVRPGKTWGDAEITIPVPEELETVPGIPMNNREVDWYAREYPLETMNTSERASRDWANDIRDQHAEMREIRKEHDKLNRNLIIAGRMTADMEPTADPSGSEILVNTHSAPSPADRRTGLGCYSRSRSDQNRQLSNIINDDSIAPWREHESRQT